MAISPQQLIRSTYTARDARGHLCDSTAFLFSVCMVVVCRDRGPLSAKCVLIGSAARTNALSFEFILLNGRRSACNRSCRLPVVVLVDHVDILLPICSVLTRIANVKM